MTVKTLRYTVHIEAPRQVVWRTMFDDAAYRDWSSAFTPGSHYVGDWSEGSEIRFLGPDPNGDGMGGMVSRIAESRPYEVLSIQHLGTVHNGVVDTTSEAVEAWKGAFETYTFRAVDDGTELVVQMDSEEAHQEMFDESWPRALDRLKTLAEEAHRAEGGRA